MRVNQFKREKRRIEILQRKIERITHPLKEEILALHKIIEGCKHPISHIVQGEYIPDDDSYFGNHSTPDFRVCKICGYAEEGWGCGYRRLRGSRKDVPEIHRHEARKFVKRMHYQKDYPWD